jgi:hypothetical protein
MSVVWFARQPTSMETAILLLKFSQFKVLMSTALGHHIELKTLLTPKWNKIKLYKSLMMMKSWTFLGYEWQEVVFRGEHTFSEETKHLVNLETDGAVLFQNNARLEHNKRLSGFKWILMRQEISFLTTLIYHLPLDYKNCYHGIVYQPVEL